MSCLPRRFHLHCGQISVLAIIGGEELDVLRWQAAFFFSLMRSGLRAPWGLPPRGAARGRGPAVAALVTPQSLKSSLSVPEYRTTAIGSSTTEHGDPTVAGRGTT